MKAGGALEADGSHPKVDETGTEDPLDMPAIINVFRGGGLKAHPKEEWGGRGGGRIPVLVRSDAATPWTQNQHRNSLSVGLTVCMCTFNPRSCFPTCCVKEHPRMSLQGPSIIARMQHTHAHNGMNKERKAEGEKWREGAKERRRNGEETARINSGLGWQY